MRSSILQSLCTMLPYNGKWVDDGYIALVVEDCVVNGKPVVVWVYSTDSSESLTERYGNISYVKITAHMDKTIDSQNELTAMHICNIINGSEQQYGVLKYVGGNISAQIEVPVYVPDPNPALTIIAAMVVHIAHMISDTSQIFEENC